MKNRYRRLLFLSNGHGEDLIAVKLIETMNINCPELEITALPIVGAGAAYMSRSIPLLLPGKEMPSGGFVRNSLRNWGMDLWAGLFDLTRRQINTLKMARAQVDIAVCVGDSYLNILAGYFLRRPIIFLPTAKSDYVSAHWPVEIHWMRQFCLKVFPRDALTAASLCRHQVPAEYLGNIMMDALEFHGTDFRIGNQAEWVIGILPGSRREAYLNMEDLARVAIAYASLVNVETAPSFLVALSGGLSFQMLAEGLTSLGWHAVRASVDEVSAGVVGHVEHPGKKWPVRLTIAQGRFGDLLANVKIVLGMAGTGNEQAVGLGKPVVTFSGRGPQFTEKFLRTQKKLLGDAILVTPRDPETTAMELFALLNDSVRYEAMARTGRERMGEPGGATRIAARIMQIIDVRKGE